MHLISREADFLTKYFCFYNTKGSQRRRWKTNQQIQCLYKRVTFQQVVSYTPLCLQEVIIKMKVRLDSALQSFKCDYRFSVDYRSVLNEVSVIVLLAARTVARKFSTGGLCSSAGELFVCAGGHVINQNSTYL